MSKAKADWAWKPTDDPVEIARATLIGHYEKMREQEPIAREGVDPEGVHRMRVRTRRGRSALRLFRKVLPADVHDRFKALLKPLADVLGRERDADVMIEWFGAFEEGASRSEKLVLAFVDAALREEKRAAHEVLLTFLDTPGYGVIVDSYEALRVQPLAKSGRKPKRFARAAVSKALRRVRVLAEVADPAHPESLHEVRVATKVVRYAAEALLPLLPKSGSELIERAVAVQDVLGEVHDLDVAEERLAAVTPSSPPRGWRAGARRLRGRIRGRREELLGSSMEAIRKVLKRKLDPGR